MASTEFLRAHWTAMLPPEQRGTTRSAALFEGLIGRYAVKRRAYHNPGHLADMFGHFDAFAPFLREKSLLAAAIFYHDAVYNPARRDNELRSADVAAKELPQLGFTAEAVESVRTFIVATQTHLLPPGTAPTDLPWLLDFDLAILGADWETYAAYARNIRREYRLYPDLLYKPGRVRALEHFLERPRIFHTPPFFEKYEAQARQNLAREIETLR